MKFKKMVRLHFDGFYATINCLLKKQKMNKNSIILALAATAHVHGAEHTSNKHYRESILGKRAYQGPQANNDGAKRQKTDQNPPEQIDISMAEQSDISMVRAVKFTDSNLFSVPKQYLTMPEVLKMCSLSKKTRQNFAGFLPKKYNNATKQWEELKVDDNLDECFTRCMTTVLVPSIANAIQDLPGIIGNKRVNHIKIAMINADPNPYPRPEGWQSMVNNLFTDPDPHNNSLTFKMVQPDDTALGWDIENLLRNISNVKNVLYEGKTGNEKIVIGVPANVGNKCVTVRNAKKLYVVDVVAELDRSVTESESTNAQFIIKGNGDLPATITASSDGGLCHTTFGTEQFALTTTLAEGRCALTFGYDPIREIGNTIRANSDSRICHKVFDTDSTYDPLFDPNPRYLHHEFKARGQSELTVASGIITARSNEYARYENYHDDARYTRYIAEACGTDNTIQVTPTGNCTIKADSDDTVRHTFQLDGGLAIWEGTAKGCKEIKAELSIDEEGKIQLESPIKLLYAYYDLGLYPGWPYQSIKTEGRSKITTWPNDGEESKRGGIVESKDDILYRKVIDHKRINAFTQHCQTTHARTNAQLTFGDKDITGKAQDLQYTEVREGKTIHDVLIKGGADFALKDNPEVRKITIKGDDVDYKNDGDTKHPHTPFSGRSGPVDILLDNKLPGGQP